MKVDVKHYGVLSSIFIMLLASSTWAAAENTTASGAVSYEVGQGWVSHAVDENSQDRWFIFRENGLRSYCIEAAIGSATYFSLEPGLELYQDSAGTAVYLTSDKSKITDPPMNKGARICYPSTQEAGKSTLRAVKIHVPIDAGSGQSGFVRLRVMDTTYSGPLMYISQGTGRNYDSILYFTNSTVSPIRVVVAAHSFGKISETTVPSGVFKSYYSIPRPAGTTAYAFGMTHILHDGPPGALDGSYMGVYYGGEITPQGLISLISR